MFRVLLNDTTVHYSSTELPRNSLEQKNPPKTKNPSTNQEQQQNQPKNQQKTHTQTKQNKTPKKQKPKQNSNNKQKQQKKEGELITRGQGTDVQPTEITFLTWESIELNTFTPADLLTI